MDNQANTHSSSSSLPEERTDEMQELRRLVRVWRAFAKREGLSADMAKAHEGCAFELEAALGATSPARSSDLTPWIRHADDCSAAAWEQRAKHHQPSYQRPACDCGLDAALTSPARSSDPHGCTCDPHCPMHGIYPARSSVSQTEKMPSVCLGNTASGSAENKSTPSVDQWPWAAIEYAVGYCCGSDRMDDVWDALQVWRERGSQK